MYPLDSIFIQLDILFLFLRRWQVDLLIFFFFNKYLQQLVLTLNKTPTQKAWLNKFVSLFNLFLCFYAGFLGELHCHRLLFQMIFDSQESSLHFHSVTVLVAHARPC